MFWPVTNDSSKPGFCNRLSVQVFTPGMAVGVFVAVAVGVTDLVGVLVNVGVVVLVEVGEGVRVGPGPVWMITQSEGSELGSFEGYEQTSINFAAVAPTSASTMRMRWP